ncbi:MAG TPA: POTRA domain-containing protein, partial [Candidatus Eisenbacteria bacterium]|nr:POTRA domain-containing protein [Candidatus Eisenbacteria bacterium]
MTSRLAPVLLLSLAVLAPRPCGAQGEHPPVLTPDSIAVQGARRNSALAVLQTSGLLPGRPLTYRDVQRAILSLYGSGQYDEVRIDQAQAAGDKNVLVIRVRERPLLVKWAVRGVQRLGERSVHDKVQLAEGRPIDPAAVERSRARIDSLYRAQGFYLAHAKPLFVYENDSTTVRVVFEVQEGRRVAIAQVRIDGNTHFSDEQILEHMKTRPEGFWWF